MPAPVLTTRYNVETSAYDWSDGQMAGSVASLAEAKLLAIHRYAAKVTQYQCRDYVREDVEDAIQEAMIGIWNLLNNPADPNYETAQAASPAWFARRTALLARSYLQRQYRKTAQSLDAMLSASPTHDPTALAAERAYEAAESAHFVSALIDEVSLWLPSNVGYLKEVVQWMVEGNSMRQAAAKAGHDTSVVSRHLARHLTPILRKLLADEDPWDLLEKDEMAEPEAAAEGLIIQLSFAFAFDQPVVDSPVLELAA